MESELLSLALEGQRAPNTQIHFEKPEHRLVLFLKAAGHSNREIAAQTGFTEPWVSQIIRQPWFQERLLQELHTEGRRTIRDLISGEAENSFHTLVRLRDTGVSEEIRAKCAIEILNRHLGKPAQTIVQEHAGSITHVLAKVDDLDTRIADLDREERELKQRLGVADRVIPVEATPFGAVEGEKQAVK